MAITITRSNILAVAHGAAPWIVDGIIENQRYAADAGLLDTPRRCAHFVAQNAHESAGFSRVEESLFYTSAKRIAAVWPSRFTEATAAPFVRQPQKLANSVYGGRMGNVGPDDGWRYRGRGLLQTTGRNSYAVLETAIREPTLTDPDRVAKFPVALRASVVYWQKNSLLRFADADDLRGLTRAINGGLIGLADRQVYLARANAVHWGNDVIEHSASTSEDDYLRLGDKGDDVRKLQERLRDLGFYTGRIDGDFGPATQDAVEWFQRSKGLRADGVVGPITDQALRLAYGSHSEPPAPPPPKPEPIEIPAGDIGGEAPASMPPPRGAITAGGTGATAVGLLSAGVDWRIALGVAAVVGVLIAVAFFALRRNTK